MSEKVVDIKEVKKDKKNNLVIDEKHLKALIEATEKFIKELQWQAKEMADKKEDIFKRYISYARLAAIMSQVSLLEMAHKNSFRMGYDLKFDIFNTPAYKEGGWIDGNISDNPFFINPSDDESLPDFNNAVAIKIPDNMQISFSKMMNEIVESLNSKTGKKDD